MKTVDYVIIGVALILLGSMHFASYPEFWIDLWAKFKKLAKREKK